ncbi:MAG: hypothetical protein KY434_00015, partial [Actinobacteria bacterium]|nr:hypothetical protein [Actinomycetota bacterium]
MGGHGVAGGRDAHAVGGTPALVDLALPLGGGLGAQRCQLLGDAGLQLGQLAPARLGGEVGVAVNALGRGDGAVLDAADAAGGGGHA